jgi:hypothetical protein
MIEMLSIWQNRVRNTQRLWRDEKAVERVLMGLELKGRKL